MNVIVPHGCSYDERDAATIGAELRRIRDNLDVELAMARAVELGEEYDLPPAEREAAALDKNGLRSCGQREFEVRVGVTLGVLEFQAGRNNSVECCFHVARDIGIVALVDQYSGCRVRHVEVADPISYAGVCDELLHARGNIDELRSA